MPEPRGTTQKNIISFNGGEWSPLLDARADQERYDAACRELTNVYLLPYGGVVRRDGLQFRAIAKFADKKNRLLPFDFSTSTSFIIEMGEGYMRFFSNGIPVTNGGDVDAVLTGTVPYLESQLFQVQFKQLNDIMYLTHPDHPQQKLSRLADDNWTIEEVIFDQTAFLDVNVSTTTLTSSVTALAANGTLTASTALFDSDHVGSYWKLTHPREASEISQNITTPGASATLVVKGTWSYRTTGTWAGITQIQAKNAATGNFETIREFTSNDDSNFDIEDNEPIETEYRIFHGSITGNGFSYLSVIDTTTDGIVQVTGFTSPTIVSIKVTEQLESTAVTDVWFEGAWSQFQGFPRAIGAFEQRIVYGGTRLQPQTVFGSKTGDFEDFERGTNDDDSFQYILASGQQNIIQWMEGQNKLLIGTSGGEWTMSGDEEKPLTPSNVTVHRQSTYGSKHLQGVMINDVVLYVQRNGRKVRELIESETVSIAAKYVSPDLTLMAEHITAGEVIQTDYAQQPDSVYWAVNGEGDMPAMTYERDQKVIGWHKQKTPGANGKFESVAVIYGNSGDEVWVSVKRTINGSDVRYIERFNPFDWVEKEDAFYVDSGITVNHPKITSGNLTSAIQYRVLYPEVVDPVTGEVTHPADPTTDMTAVGGPSFPIHFEVFTATSTATPVYGTATIRQVQGTFSGLAHIEGEIVQILGDGAVHPSQTVSGGQITIPDDVLVSVAHIGLAFETVIQPMKLDADARLGAYMATRLRVRALVVRFSRSLGMSWGTNLENNDGTLEFTKFPFKDTTDLMDASAPLFTGDKEIALQSRHANEGDITIKQTDPLPMTVLAIVMKLEVTGR